MLSISHVEFHLIPLLGNHSVYGHQQRWEARCDYCELEWEQFVAATWDWKWNFWDGDSAQRGVQSDLCGDGRLERRWKTRHRRGEQWDYHWQLCGFYPDR